MGRPIRTAPQLNVTDRRFRVSRASRFADRLDTSRMRWSIVALAGA